MKFESPNGIVLTPEGGVSIWKGISGLLGVVAVGKERALETQNDIILTPEAVQLSVPTRSFNLEGHFGVARCSSEHFGAIRYD